MNTVLLFGSLGPSLTLLHGLAPCPTPVHGLKTCTEPSRFSKRNAGVQGFAAAPFPDPCSFLGEEDTAVLSSSPSQPTPPQLSSGYPA